MPSKRKRDILDGFDPNKSDSEDENFSPTEDQPRRSAKKSRSARPTGSRGRPPKRGNKYRGSDIDDDDDEASDSDREDSFVEEDEESDEDLPKNAAGRRIRKAAVKRPSYKESSDDEEVIKNSDGEDGQLKGSPQQKRTKIVVLKTTGRAQRASKRGKDEQLPPSQPVRRTRAHTEEIEEPLVELSNSGKHAQPARGASRSKSPETITRATRATRGAKGLKQPPTPIQEATQESEPKEEAPEAMEDVNETPQTKGGEDNSFSDAEEAEADPEDAPMEDQQGDQVEAAPDAPADEDDEDDDEMPITRTRRGRVQAAHAEAEEAESDNTGGRRLTRKSTLRGRGTRKNLQEPSSDFEPGEESGDGAASEASEKAATNDDDESTPTPRGRASRGASRKGGRAQQESGDEEIELDKDEMAEELMELRRSSRSRPRRTRRSPSIVYEERTTKKRRTKPVNYTIPAVDAAAFEVEEDDGEPAATPARNRRGGKNGSTTVWERGFNSTYGPFGGGGGPGSLLGGPWGTGATATVGNVDSDSSDDEMNMRSGVGGAMGMTPTSAVPPVGLFNPMGGEGAGGIGGATPQVGKVKNQKAYADADPLGVDMSVDFSKVGGLQNHIDQLKEMVQLPLLYPELFQRFSVTPPRGVLFHGPPGTGKTLLARALANSVGSGGRKISFYMRKGADALSKWVGEAEKQLRLLFEEARRTQPSIIFFDEIDGLAPVRSSKQEQIHASIVSTLLALMDGMDGRGQVIVIGATNRPDNIDPALRRPGRFDREFYFPLPDLEARRSILDIHTKGWGISNEFKTALAENTKGYGGADLRALCTEAALNAIQRTYPQIYSSKEKLVVDPDKITIHASDFMISVKKMIPSSERSTTSAAVPLPRTIEPLLRSQYDAIITMLDSIFPRHKKMTALEEAMYEPYEDADHGFGREAMHSEFERSRSYRPRLLISGLPGNGQAYLASAVLHHLEGVHVQTMDLASLLGDGRPLEQVLSAKFTEIKRHKPSVIFIPNAEVWYTNMTDSALAVFNTVLNSITTSDPVLLLATAENTPEMMSPEMLRDLFPYSRKNRAVVQPPGRESRYEFFEPLAGHLQKSPNEFPDPANRKKRVLIDLPVAPPPPPRTLTKEEIRAQRKIDLHNLNILKTRLQPIMDQINRKYRKFRQPVIPKSAIEYLFEEQSPNFVRPDIPEGEKRPYEIAKDKEGTEGLRDTATGAFFYNLETTTIEERLANGYYARPMDFYKDINRLYLDSKNIGDRDRILKANELRTNVEVDVYDIATSLGNQGIRFEEIYQRQLQRAKEAEEKANKQMAMQEVVDLVQSDIPGDVGDSDSQGPVGIGLPLTRDVRTAARFQPILSPPSNGQGETAESRQFTNGTPTKHGEDVHMGGMDDDTQPVSLPGTDLASPLQWPIPRGGPVGDSAGATAGTALSQRSAITSVPPGMSPSALRNDASTTKTSDPSTNQSNNWSTQHTNGTGPNQDDNSQLLDTQSQTGQGSNPHSGHSQGSGISSERGDWLHSQADAIAKGVLPSRFGIQNLGGSITGGTPSSSQKNSSSSSPRKAGAPLDNMLNEDAPASVNASGSSHSNSQAPATPATGSGGPNSQGRASGVSATSSQQPVIHEGTLVEFLDILADRTAGCSVEQLEQIYRELMDEIWKTRHEWNRMLVLSNLGSVFNDTIADIETVQGVLLEDLREVDDDEEEGNSSQLSFGRKSVNSNSVVIESVETGAAAAWLHGVGAAAGGGDSQGSVGAGGDGLSMLMKRKKDDKKGKKKELEQWVYLR
ncbi:putative ATPase family AAA domain-containing protein [Podospora fimiseda]|uniref:ATPase family AAA domain-containing protein n=1 Tax=Podospora fimiseda TaxID=252190 RepID=A0AAN7BW97_9PEZI|nr:putative ATPase family AAA domain-containing protein [Podospora fimiseda]